MKTYHVNRSETEIATTRAAIETENSNMFFCLLDSYESFALSDAEFREIQFMRTVTESIVCERMKLYVFESDNGRFVVTFSDFHDYAHEDDDITNAHTIRVRLNLTRKQACKFLADLHSIACE